MDSVARPLWISSLVFGVAPLDLFPGISKKMALAYSIVFYLFIQIYCPFAALAMHIKQIPTFLSKGDSQAATSSLVVCTFTVLTIVVGTIAMFIVITGGKYLLVFAEELSEISRRVGILTSDRSSIYLKRLLLIFWPFFTYWNCKELGIYSNLKEFYVNTEECLAYLGRVVQMHLEEQFKFNVREQQWIFEGINSQLKKIASGRKSNHTPNLAEQIETIRRCHFRLCEMSPDLVMYFQAFFVVQYPMLLMDIVQGFYFTSITLFNLVGDKGDESFSEGMRTFIIFDCSCWSLICLARLTFLISACDMSCKQAAETRNIVQKMEQDEENASIKEEILRFSVQLQHVPTPLYSVFGIFTFNTELLAATISSAFTYIIILMQFHNLA